MEAAFRRTIFKDAIAWCAAITAFFLIFRSGTTVKIADALLVLLGIMVIAGAETRTFFVVVWPRIRSYLGYFGLLLGSLILAQAIGYFIFGENPLNVPTAGYYMRTAFNMYAFLLAAFLIAFDGRLLRRMSAAILASPIVMLPIYRQLDSDWYVSGSRLAGFLQNPIVLGIWMMAIFFIGLGFFLDAKVSWKKIGIVLWLTIIANFVLWSGTRTAWMGIFFGLLLWIGYSLKKGRMRQAGYLIVIPCIAFFFGYALLAVSSRPNRSIQVFLAERASALVTQPLSGQFKADHWAKGIRLAINDPFGTGFPTPSSAEPLPDTNTFIQIMLYGGIGALAAYLIFLAKLGADIAKIMARMKNSGADQIAIAWCIIASAITLTTFFNESFFFRLIWIALGIAAGTAWTNQYDAGENFPDRGTETPWVNAVLPPFLRQLITQFRNHYTFRFYGISFYGTFDSFADVFKEFPGETTPYHSKASLNEEISAFRDLRRSMADAKKGISPVPFDKTTLLTGLVASHPKDQPTVLDIGGGGGMLFPYLIYSCPLKHPRLIVQELPEVAAAGKKEFADGTIGFVSELSEVKSPVDFAYFGSSLQYFEDYGPILEQVASLKPDCIFIAQTPMTIHPSFVTAQVNLRKRIVPIRVINKDGLIATMRRHGFKLVHQSKSMSGANFHNFAPGTFILNLVFVQM